MALQRQQYWCWQTREVLDLIHWLHDFNQAQKNAHKIRFVGVDVQQVEAGALELSQYLRRQHPHLSHCLHTLAHGNFDNIETSETMAELGKLELPQFLKTTATNIYRYLDTYCNKQHQDGLAKREPYMAQTLIESVGTQQGTVYWAHNEHVAVNADFAGCCSAGWFLRDHYGQAYLSLGMLLGEGKFRAKDMHQQGRPITTFRVIPPDSTYVECNFLGQPAGIYSVTSKAPYRRFLGSFYNSTTAQTNPDAFRITHQSSHFDLIAWLPHTRGTVGLE